LTWVEGFFIIKFYPAVEQSFGIDPVMFFFTFTCCFAGFFTIFCLPETKGRNIEEIAKSIGKKEKSHSEK
jgi:hypothetical protein